MSALLQSENAAASDVAVSDHSLVAAVRRGDDRAFETLYQRYCRRIQAYVYGMVKDHQRAEDVTQEVFVSALRRMRATERPIAFKPWIYEIAKNACIDQFRRSKRAEEVSFDAEEGLAPADYGRLVSKDPVPDAAVAAKQELDHMVGAFGGLSEAHHQILVLRELEGLSYREIGERMGMTRAAVESTLFRARRRLSEEYDELASGQRCLRIQDIIATATTGRLGARDTRRLARHVAHCQPCRRQALAAGVDQALVARAPLRRRAMEKVAGLFPFPLLLRARRDGSADGWSAQLPLLSDHAAAGGAKLAAVAALVVAGVGAGVGTQVAQREDRAAERPAPASERAPAATATGASLSLSPAVTSARSAREGAAASRDAAAGRSKAAERRSAGKAERRRQASAPAARDGGSGAAAPAVERAVADPVRNAPGASAPAAPSAPSTSAPKVPEAKVELQVPAVPEPGATVERTAPSLPVNPGQTTAPAVPAPVEDVTKPVQDAVGGATQGVQGAAQGVQGATGVKLP